jgi:hypothetical protein
MITPLDDYMKRHSLNDAGFATRIGKDRSLVNRIRRGVIRPTLEVASQIEVETEGEVPMQSWTLTKGEAA